MNAQETSKSARFPGFSERHLKSGGSRRSPGLLRLFLSLTAELAKKKKKATDAPPTLHLMSRRGGRERESKNDRRGKKKTVCAKIDGVMILEGLHAVGAARGYINLCFMSVRRCQKDKG